MNVTENQPEEKKGSGADREMLPGKNEPQSVASVYNQAVLYAAAALYSGAAPDPAESKGTPCIRTRGIAE